MAQAFKIAVTRALEPVAEDLNRDSRKVLSISEQRFPSSEKVSK